MTLLTLEGISGISLGIQYVDDYEDEDGEWFIVIIELLFVRVMLHLKKEQTV
jgi:hypothetical protein